MHHCAKVFEGMRAGDLADLVLPLISIDEYMSRVDPTQCLTFGFYVHDEDAANDLNRFLQKSSTPILDSEVSPAPDQHGYYMVFMEFMNNDQLPAVITAILAEVKGLVDIEDWQMRVRSIDELVPFSEDNLKDCIKKLKQEDKHKDVLEFLYPSILKNVLFENDLIILEGSGQRHVLHLIEFDRITAIMQGRELTESAISFGIRDIARVNRLRYVLGEEWDVAAIGRFLLLHRSDDPRGLLLR